MISRDLARQCIDTFGATHQLLKSGEEASEYSGAIHRYHQAIIANDHRRLMEFRSKAIGELVDVLITAHQARIIFGEDDVDRQIQATEMALLDRVRKARGE